jgi:hypothetical protein
MAFCDDMERLRPILHVKLFNLQCAAKSQVQKAGAPFLPCKVEATLLANHELFNLASSFGELSGCAATPSFCDTNCQLLQCKNTVSAKRTSGLCRGFVSQEWAVKAGCQLKTGLCSKKKGCCSK